MSYRLLALSPARKYRFSLLPLLILWLAALVRPADAQVLALEFTSASTTTPRANVSGGWSFTTNQAVTVDALDEFDSTGNGTDNVRLYSATSLLAEATVTNSDATVGTPTPFYSQAITPVTLAAGQTYYIASGIVGGTTTVDSRVNGLITNPSITYGAAVLALGLGLDPTTDIDVGQDNPGDFGPNFNIGLQQSAGTPEPGSVALAIGAAITCIGAGLRRRRIRNSAK